MSKSKKPSFNFEKIDRQFKRARRYSFVAFVIFVVAIYGFVLLRISALGNTQPSDQAVAEQVQAANVPNIDQAVVSQLKALQDNSVNVQSLFDQARTNPFQEVTP